MEAKFAKCSRVQSMPVGYINLLINILVKVEFGFGLQYKVVFYYISRLEDFCLRKHARVIVIIVGSCLT